MQEWTTVPKPTAVLGRYLETASQGLTGQPGGVWRDDHTVRGEQLVVSQGRLLGKDIESGPAELARLQGVDARGLIY